MANEIEAEITVSTDEGVHVPITINISWPGQMGYYALQALTKFDEVKSQLWDSVLHQLINNGDMSLLAHLPDDHAGGDDEDV